MGLRKRRDDTHEGFLNRKASIRYIFEHAWSRRRAELKQYEEVFNKNADHLE